MSLHFPNEYNQYCGQETIESEYKEFTFNLAGLSIDPKLAEQYCTSNVFDFNKSVILNLNKYFKTSLPKYACGYFNSGFDGSYYIGINDYGFVKGIPFKGQIPVQQLKDKIIKTLRSSVTNDNTDIDWEQLVRIQIKKIDYDTLRTGELEKNQKFLSYVQSKQKYLEEYNDFVERTDKWRLRMNFSVNKLVDLANNQESRNKIIQYIKSVDPTNPVINIFESDDFRLGYKSHDEIIKIRDDPNDPYYWVTRWKDIVVDSIKADRPVLHSTFNLHNTPINLMVSVSEMLPYWLTCNSNMNLYVIQIDFYGSKLAFGNSYSDELFSSVYNNFRYLDANTRRSIRCYRTVLATGDPVCLPF